MYHHATVNVVVATDAPMMLLYSSVYVRVAYILDICRPILYLTAAQPVGCLLLGRIIASGI